MPNNYLSLFATGRSVDLFFENEEECFDWFSLLGWLVKKEKVSIYELLSLENPVTSESPEFDVLVYKSIIGIRNDAYLSNSVG